jgi:large subunit ribosomal protein L35
MAKKIKVKTHSGAKKRFKKTGNGFKHKQATVRHKLTAKSNKRKRQLRGTKLVPACDVRSIEYMLPHA